MKNNVTPFFLSFWHLSGAPIIVAVCVLQLHKINAGYLCSRGAITFPLHIATIPLLAPFNIKSNRKYIHRLQFQGLCCKKSQFIGFHHFSPGTTLVEISVPAQWEFYIPTINHVSNWYFVLFFLTTNNIVVVILVVINFPFSMTQNRFM